MIRIMSDDHWTDIFAGAGRRDIGAGEVLFRHEQRVRSMHLVLSGSVDLVRHLPHGVTVTLQRARPGRVLAEASLFADRYHCDAVATEASRIAVLPVKAAFDTLASSGALALGFLRDTAREVQYLRSRVELLRLKRLSDRLDAYLALHGPPGPGTWRDVASEIGVTPEALYRELAKRRR
ncbi:MAG: Crp/Fnr family transcriptional regulator [Inquilinaceae bacterium]